MMFFTSSYVVTQWLPLVTNCLSLQCAYCSRPPSPLNGYNSHRLELLRFRIELLQPALVDAFALRI